MWWFLWILVGIGAAYQLVALLAGLRQLFRRETATTHLPPVSILKPLHGMDPRLRQCLRSHATIDYPCFELLFGVSDPRDATLEEVARLQREFPHLSIRLFAVSTTAPNAKVGVLQELARHASYPLLLVNDSDIEVEPDYLRRLVGALENPRVGVVTCLYRAAAEHWPGKWEALGIATDFAPSVLVAPFVGVREFALGSTMLFRAADLERAGGFAALEDFLADDYQLGKHLVALGYRTHLAKVVVTTHLLGASWRQVWDHQVRWARTVRVSRGDGYIGLPVTHAVLWAALALALGQPVIAAALLALRYAVAVVVGSFVLRDKTLWRMLALLPIRDLWGMAVWAAGLTGDTVRWRDKLLVLRRDGKIQVAGATASPPVAEENVGVGAPKGGSV